MAEDDPGGEADDTDEEPVVANAPGGVADDVNATVEFVEVAYREAAEQRANYSFSDPERMRALNAAMAESNEVSMKWSLFWVLIGLLVFAELSTVALFFLYMMWGAHWNPPARTLDIWVGATAIQIFSLAQIVVRNLFPLRRPKNKRGSAPK